jgi:hypothetical protein
MNAAAAGLLAKSGKETKSGWRTSFGPIMTSLQTARAILLAGFAVCAAAPALAAGVVDAPMALDGTMILPDPILHRGDVVPAAAANAGVAAVSAASDGPLRNCSRRNPCALPTPARDHVVIGSGQAAATAKRPGVKYARALKGHRA